MLFQVKWYYNLYRTWSISCCWCSSCKHAWLASEFLPQLTPERLRSGKNILVVKGYCLEKCHDWMDNLGTSQEMFQHFCQQQKWSFGVVLISRLLIDEIWQDVHLHCAVVVAKTGTDVLFCCISICILFSSNSLRWWYTINKPILTWSNNNFVLMYYVLVNKVNNEIHNLLQSTVQPKMCICIYLFEPKFALFYSKNEPRRSCQSRFWVQIKHCDFIQVQTWQSVETWQWICL